MKEAVPGEYSGLIIAALILMIVLIVVFMCLQLFSTWKSSQPLADGFTGYSPSCGSNWKQNRYRCGGLTSGAMPSIESGYACMGKLGCGLLGVPP